MRAAVDRDRVDVFPLTPRDHVRVRVPRCTCRNALSDGVQARWVHAVAGSCVGHAGRGPGPHHAYTDNKGVDPCGAHLTCC
jgi:hypothetical protein